MIKQSMTALAAAALAAVLAAGAATAMPNLPAAQMLEAKAGQGHVQLVGGKKLKASKAKATKRRAGAKKLAGKGGGVRDTCPGGNQACIDTLIASCDKAGGGLSTEPDGGVDCYVVGIHDQP